MPRRLVLFRKLILLVLLPTVVSAGGCTRGLEINPAFAVSDDEAWAMMRAMRREPKTPERPILVLGGWADSMMMTSRLARHLRRVTSEEAEIAHVTFLGAGSFDVARQRVLREVERSFGDLDPDADESAEAGGEPQDELETIEVDVVAYSMGGLVARYCALPWDDGRPRLKIRQLYTIATPHRGAKLAILPGLDACAVDMRPGSALLALLDMMYPQAAYEMVCYTRLGDIVVGEGNTAPYGETPWWLPTPAGLLSHAEAYRDPRILADIGRRLRGETPLTQGPAEPLPGEDRERLADAPETRGMPFAEAGAPVAAR